MSTAPDLSASPFLSGNFAPTHNEVDRACKEVIGTIPADFRGSFLRVGPNPLVAPLSIERYHPFDGDGMVHQLAFSNGNAQYRNRFVETPGLAREREAGKALWGGFMDIGNSPRPDDMPLKNLANTAFVHQAGRTFATFEAGAPVEIELENLSTIGEEKFDGQWKTSFTAHPKVDPRNDDLVFLGYSPFPPYVRYGVADKTGKLVHDVPLELPRAVMIHDMAITENYTLILDMPVTFSLERVGQGGPAFAWEPENGARIGVIPRRGTSEDMRWFEVDLGYIFHVFNAWEEGEHIVLDACRSNQTQILTSDGASAEDEMARFRQYRLNLITGRSEERDMAAAFLDFPRINETRMSHKNQFGYASGFATEYGASLLFDSIVKFDRETESLETIELGNGTYTQEFVFAPRVGARTEDDGYVVGLIRDEPNALSECWIIDAQRFGDGPVARIQIPERVPYGFHSHWVDQPGPPSA
ncbi:MAG: carotenoid oxygenase family protein [Myxococcota bacterium]